MAQYIDKASLVEEIEKLNGSIPCYPTLAEKDAYIYGVNDALDNIYRIKVKESEDGGDYIQADAFTEKACDFIASNIYDYIDVTHKGGIENVELQEKFFEDFKVMKLDTEHVLEFRGDNKYRPADYPPKENGYYMTIRCGLGGIYTHLDEWKDGHWMVGIADASKVIAYTENPIQKEIVNEWCREKLKRYKETLK